MKVFALIFEIGISSGQSKLIGIYSTKEKAEEIKENHMKKYFYSERNYYITEIEMDKEINIVFAEW